MFLAFKTNKMEQIVKAYKQGYSQYMIAKVLELKDKKISTWQSNAMRYEAPLVLRNMITKHKKGLQMISLVSPSKAKNHNTWAVNQRFYEILVNTVTY